MYRIVSAGTKELVVATLLITERDQAGRVLRNHEIEARDGTFHFDADFRRCRYEVHVFPVDGHWCRKTELVPKIFDIDVGQFLPPAYEWWKKVVRPHASDEGAGVRVGIVDIGFVPTGSLSHVRVVDIEGENLTSPLASGVTHGQEVAMLLARKAEAARDRGLACNADIVLVNVGAYVTTPIGKKLTWHYASIKSAIELLVEEYDVDIINLSGGVPSKGYTVDDLAPLYDAISYARRRGVICLAAVGNSGGHEPAYPAKFRHTVGVAAFGLSGLDRSGLSTVCAAEIEALLMDKTTGRLTGGETIYHYTGSCSGPGVNVLGPGVGIVLTHDDGQTMDVSGTSYACPIVSAVLADRLSNDRAYRGLDGRAKWRYAWNALREMCVDPGIEKSRQGRGVPVRLQAELA